MAELSILFGILGQLKPLLDRVIDAVEMTLIYDKSCRDLSASLVKLQRLLPHIENQAPNLSSKVSLVHTWLADLEKRLRAAETTLNKRNEQHPGLTAPWSRYRSAKQIKNLTKGLDKLLQESPLAALDVALSLSAKVESGIKDTQLAVQDVGNQLSNVRRQLADVTRECFRPSGGKSLNIEEATAAIITALQNMNATDDHDKRTEALPLTLNPQQPLPKVHVPRYIFGLDDLTGRLQKFLVSGSNDADPRSVGVWGKGGVGKTLLARRAHNSMDVQQHFPAENIISLTVGKDPNIRSLYGAFSAKLNLPQFIDISETDWKDELYREFLTKRTLFIVDNVWEESVVEWLDLAKGPGSVTLWTSRKERVLLIAGVTEATKLHIDKLSEEDSWRLFCVHAFGQSNIPPGVEQLARSVVECQGLPLAVTVIGGVMIDKKLPGQWKRELNKLKESCSNHQDVQKKLFDHLKISYEDLENADHPHAKECFLYFAAFREDELLEQNRLFQYWVAEGLVPGEVGDDPENDAYHVLGLLIGRSLIELGSDECSPDKFLL